MSHSVFLLGRTKPTLILRDQYGFEMGVRTRIVCMLRVGRAGESLEILADAGLFARRAVRIDRRMKKKKHGVLVFSAVLSETGALVTPIYVRHQQCLRSTWADETIRSVWDGLTALPGPHSHVVRYHGSEGENRLGVEESSEVWEEFLGLRARGGASFAAPIFAGVVEVTVASD